jgi:putative FMN-dependent luciferase-like monooxygenase
VAEDTAVLDLMSDGRLEVGVGVGGNLSSYAAFGQDSAERTATLVAHLQLLRDAWAGRPLPGGADRLYPDRPSLVDRVWQATFSVEGARRAGAAGDGLMLSRTQPRPSGAPGLSLSEIQNPMIDAYLAALPAGRAARILASRTVFVADDHAEALRLAEIGLGRHRARLARLGRATPDGSSLAMIGAMDAHVGAPDEVVASLQRDSALARATDVAVQVHSIDPPHPFTLRSIELVADAVAPALGWGRHAAGAGVAGDH